MINKRIAVILVNWNSFDVTNDCILSLKKVQPDNFSIIVVDNGSADQSGTRLRDLHPEIILLESPVNTGFTGGNNIGFRYSLAHGYEYSIMLNNDTFVQPDFLNILCSYMDQHPDVGIVQPRIFYHHDRNLIWNGGSYFNRFLGYTYTKGEAKPSDEKYNFEKEVDWVTGCAFFVRNNIIEKTGLLAENMFIYSEDVDLSFRIRKLGYRLMYLPSSVIYHISGMSNTSRTKGEEGYVSPGAHYLNQRNRLWILKRYIPWYFAPSAIIFNFFYISLVIGYFALRKRFKKLRAVLRAVRDGIRGSIIYNH